MLEQSGKRADIKGHPNTDPRKMKWVSEISEVDWLRLSGWSNQNE